MIDGIVVSGANYGSAVRILKEKLGRTDIIISALYQRQESLQPAGSTFSEIQRMYENVESIATIGEPR